MLLPARRLHRNTVGGFAATHEPIGARGQRPKRISATLLARARIGIAHGGRQLIQPAIKGSPGGGQHIPVTAAIPDSPASTSTTDLWRPRQRDVSQRSTLAAT
jgi:hypothetical protein